MFHMGKGELHKIIAGPHFKKEKNKQRKKEWKAQTLRAPDLEDWVTYK